MQRYIFFTNLQKPKLLHLFYTLHTFTSFFFFSLHYLHVHFCKVFLWDILLKYYLLPYTFFLHQAHIIPGFCHFLYKYCHYIQIHKSLRTLRLLFFNARNAKCSAKNAKNRMITNNYQFLSEHSYRFFDFAALFAPYYIFPSICYCQSE